MNDQRGFTLIEMMITVAIIGVLCAMAAPFSGAWVDKNQVNQTASQLSEAYGRGKAAGLRNRQAVSQGKAAALVCISGNGITLQEANEGATSATCNGTATWVGSFSRNITISDVNTKVGCIAFDSRGMQIAPSDMTCSGQITFTIARGSVSAQVTLN